MKIKQFKISGKKQKRKGLNNQENIN